MEGFYSNLLSKNVSLGGDVQTSAVSAFTAVNQLNDQLAQSSNRNASHQSGSSVDTPIISESHVHANSILGKRSISEVREELGNNIEHTDVVRHDDVISPAVDVTIVKVTTVSIPQETVISARDRYLARKQQQS